MDTSRACKIIFLPGLLAIGLHLTACTGKDTPTRDNSATDTTAPVISLNGSANTQILVSSSYTEPGAVCSDNVDASKAATVGGDTVVTGVAAVFTITYNCTDAAGNSATQVTRTVSVINTDTTAPLITLTGANPVNLSTGQNYTEPGAICSDNIDADKAATVSGDTVVTSAPAVFTILYDCTDAAGNPATQVTRTVNVTSSPAYGLSVRPSNSTCSLPDAPVTTTGYELTRVFPALSFSRPIALVQSPVNADRWYVLQQDGMIYTFLTNDTNPTVFADLTARVDDSDNSEMGLLGVALHPDFASNSYMYLSYTGADLGVDGSHDSYISRFTLTDEDTLNTASEVVVLRIDQPYSNHNGGNIAFGPDGYLYIGMGDGGLGNDPQNRAQNIDSLLGKMLRIDVNGTANGNYSVPADNPFVGIAGADEIYAVGLRNPWRWSFDRNTGNLIAGDVGQYFWEEVDIIENGGNYGWSCYEGTHVNNDTNMPSCPAASAYDAPIYEYDHNNGIAITGGYVYNGSISSLVGKYLFTDYGTGPIWVMNDPFGTPSVSALIDNTTTNGMYKSSFAEDLNGELYVLSYGDGFIYRIDAASGTGNGSFPDLLSETGCFNMSAASKMATGLIPFDINAPFWSDGAVKDRWLAIPDNSTISIDTNEDWTFPSNSVLVKNFRINNQLVETRLLVRHSNGSWAGYSYEWNNTETDATYLPNGKTKTIGSQTYVYPSPAECMECHTSAAGRALGPETRQLNRNMTYTSTGVTANQIDTLNHIGLFSTTLAAASALPTLTQPTDTGASLHDRARAYLYTNCSQCHRPGGGTNVNMNFDIRTADANMNVCNVTSIHPVGTATTRLVPGDANASTIYRRMHCRDGDAGCNNGDQMPPLGSTLVDTDGAALLAEWINSLGACP